MRNHLPRGYELATIANSLRPITFKAEVTDLAVLN
jgi:hypothetical protein